MSTGRFACLRAHSWFSLLEGTHAPGSMLRRAAECGYSTLALTDTNSLAGVVEFLEAAKEHGVRPIVGAHLKHQSQRVTVLVGEPSGYRSLCRIISRLNFTNPPALAPVLVENAEGLHLLCDDPFILKPPLTDTFRGRLWMEIVRPGKGERGELALIDYGSKLGLKPVASLGAMFPTQSGHAVYRLLRAVAEGVPIDKLPAKLPVLPGNHLATTEEVHERFRDMPAAIANAHALAEMCRSDVLPRGTTMPPAKIPPGQDAQGYLRLVCEQAFRQKQWTNEPNARHRLEDELSLFAQRDLAPYVLVVADVAAESRRRGWPMALRGSAGASLICFLLSISDTNPLDHGLRVERFLHLGRETLPDLDLDLASEVRKSVFSWMLHRYGLDRVARVGSVEHLGCRSAFQAACLAFGLSHQQATALVQDLGGAVDSLRDKDNPALTLAPPTWPLEPTAWQKVVASARMLCGRPKELTVHPSGLVLSSQLVDNLIPVHKGPGSVRVSQLDKHGVERVGLVKIDLLSNRALSTLAEARRHLQALCPEEATRSAEEGDTATIALLGRGETLGISQLETPGMRRLLRQAAPALLSDLANVLAVARPGAGGGRDTYLRRRHGVEPTRYAHASLEPILRDSLGVVLTDDDAMSVVEALTGLPAAEAERFRQKLADEEAANEAAQAVIAAAEKNAVPRAVVEEVLPQLRRAGAYSFCKAHAVSYAGIAWQEAYLKAHHPLAFWTAALNNHQGAYPRRVHVEAVKRAGLSVYHPCVNRSQKVFTVEVSGIRTGLSAVRSLSAHAMEAVLDERDKGGPFASVKDFRNRVQLSVQDYALLVRAGALDVFGQGRLALLRDAEAMNHGRLPSWWKEEYVEGWFDDLLGSHPLNLQWRDEWALLGYLPGGVPLMHLLRASLPVDLRDSRNLEGEDVSVAGLVALAKTLPGEEEEPAHLLTLEDEWGLVEVVAEPGASEAAKIAKLGPLLVATGEVEQRYGVPVLIAERVERPLLGTDRQPGIRLRPVA